MTSVAAHDLTAVWLVRCGCGDYYCAREHICSAHTTEAAARQAANACTNQQHVHHPEYDVERIDVHHS